MYIRVTVMLRADLCSLSMLNERKLMFYVTTCTQTVLEDLAGNSPSQQRSEIT